MARQFMGGDFRAISKVEPVAAEVEPDPRLALVDLFKDTQVAQTSGTIDLAAPLPEGVIDLSGNTPDYAALFAEDSYSIVGDTQEPVVEPEPVTGDAGPDEAATPEDEAPADAEPDEKVEPPQEKQDEQDYDPIAAVLG